MSGKAKIVLTDYVWESLDIEHQILDEVGSLVAFKTSTPEEFVREARDCDALLNTYSGPITAAVMAELPRCKIIARYGIGVDTIDLDAATDAGIIVTNNPTYCIDEVAEHAMAMILDCVRKISFYDRRVRSGEWAVPPGKPIARLAGSTLGLVGFGNIARRVAVRARAFDMRVIFADPFVDNASVPTGCTKMPLEDVLAQADILSLHPPLNPKTRGMIDDAALALMKPSAFLVNVSRGPIIDTAALVRALDARRIAGCALDTTDPEPLPAVHALRGRENVVITPHSAWYSEQAMVSLQKGAPSEVAHVLRGTWPVNVVNPSVRARNRAGI